MQLKCSVEGRRMYLFRSDISSCLESTEIWHAYCLCVKKKILFEKAVEYGPNCAKIHFPLSVSVSKHCRISILENCACVCLTALDEGGGGGGRSFKSVFEALFPRLWKKKTGTFFDAQRVGMPNFSGFRATK